MRNDNLARFCADADFSTEIYGTQRSFFVFHLYGLEYLRYEDVYARAHDSCSILKVVDFARALFSSFSSLPFAVAIISS